MNEEKAFAAAIAARPDDDLPKLVYADWLDERGRGAEAEQWRIKAALREIGEGHDVRQCEMAGHLCETCTKIQVLTIRTAELFAEREKQREAQNV